MATTYGKIELGNSAHKGWYLLSAAKKDAPVKKGNADGVKYTSSANDMTQFTSDHGDLEDVPFDCLSNFQQLLMDNFYHDNNKYNGSKLTGKLQFGTNIYYFNHESTPKTLTAGDGWPATKNFLQSHWDTIQISDKDWNNDTVGSGVSINSTTRNTLVITAVGNPTNSYRHVPIDMRKGYWVYIVQNNPLV